VARLGGEEGIELGRCVREVAQSKPGFDAPRPGGRRERYDASTLTAAELAVAELLERFPSEQVQGRREGGRRVGRATIPAGRRTRADQSFEVDHVDDGVGAGLQRVTPAVA